MAVTIRKGNQIDFDPNKLVPGELGLVLDAGELYFCYSAGNTKKLTTAEDVQALLDSTPDAYAALLQCIGDLNNNPSELTNILNNISALQSGKLDKSEFNDAIGDRSQLPTPNSDLVSSVIEVSSQLDSTLNNINSKFITRLMDGQVTKIKLIGDSITDGNGTRSYASPSTSNPVIFNDGAGNIFYEPNQTNNGWAQKFKTFIADDYSSVQFTNAGIGGKSAKWANTNKAYWVSEIEDVVFVMLGTNDRWDCATPAEFKTNLISFLNYVKAKCNLMIVMTAPPTLNDNDTGTYHFGMKEVDRVITEVCQESQYIHISHYRHLLDYAEKTGSIRTLIEKDGSHPNDEGYDAVWKSIQQRLGFTNGVTNWENGSLSNPIIAIHGNSFPYLQSTTPITDFVNGKETIIETYGTYTDIINFPEGASGRLRTIRGLANDLYSYQLFEPREVNSVYKRTWNYGSSIWNAWEKISTSNLGTIYSTTTKLVTSVSSGANTNVASLSLPPGTYVVTGSIRWDTPGSDDRYITITQGSASQVKGVEFMTNTAIVELSSTTTIYLVGTQTSGSNLNLNSVVLNAVKIK
jgi:lysophospholipase L1-like esterase